MRILNDFGVNIPLLEMVLESGDMSQEAEKVSGPQNMRKRGMMDLKRKLTIDVVCGGNGGDAGETGVKDLLWRWFWLRFLSAVVV